MDDIYTNLENYDDFNKLEELKNENKNLKCKIDEYTSAINKLQKDFDMLADEHKKLELNYSSLLKTAKAQIERKTHMIKELNLEKDKLIINARQNNFKSKFNKFQSDRFNRSNKSSDTGSVHEQPQTLNPTSQATNEYKNNNSSPLDTVSTCSGDTRDLNDTACTANKNIKHDTENYISKENPVQVSNNNSNRQTETKVKKIMNRRKSMPVSRCRDVNFSSDDERESCETTVNKIQHPTRDEIKRSTDRYYQKHKTYETSNLENNYTQYESSSYSRIKPNYYSDHYRSRDSYDSSQRRRWNLSPDRATHRSGRDHTDHYQTYNRRGYESPPRDKHYQKSRSTDHRYSYHRDRSRDYRNNDTERYAEKHRLQDLEEPSYKRQKHERSHRYTEDDGRLRESSAGRAALPAIFEMSVSCQSPDYMHPDNHISTAPVKEIRSIAIMHLEDPRLSSNKYKLVTDCDKEMLSTTIGRNIDIIPVNRKLWGFNPVPMPKALIEPPSSFEYNVKRNFNMDNDYATQNILVDSNEIKSNRTTNGDHYLRNDSADLTSTTNSTAVSDLTAPIETQDTKNSKIHHTSVNKESKSQVAKEKNDKVSAKQLSSAYRIRKKQNSSEVLTNTETLDSKNNSYLNPRENCYVEAKSLPLSDNVKSNTGKEKDEYSLEKRQEELYVENIIENRNHELAISRKIVESDLTLSDDTSDYVEPRLTIIESQTKGKRNRRKESSEKHKSNGLDPRKPESASESLPDAKTVEVKGKRSPEEDKIKRKGEPTEHIKKQKNKKKQEDKDCEAEDSKTCKSKKAKKETKPTEIKTKFSELFGDSSSLITCDDLGVVTREPEYRTNFDTLIEDTQDAVDINIKEIEKRQATKLTSGIDQNELVEKQDDRQNKMENKKCDDLKISIRKKEDKYSIVHDSTEPVMFNKNINFEVCNIPKTIIISTGMQQQNTFNDIEFRQPLSVAAAEKVVQPFLSPGLEALATSTPAKLTPEQSLKDSVTAQSDCSSSSTEARIDMPQTRHESSCTESQNADVPDVRIFVKRRRKTKKITT